MNKVLQSLLLGGLFYSANLHAAYVPVPVTGFNADVIANGVGTAATTTTNDVDGASYCYVSNGWQLNASSTPITTGLPATGLINSALTTGLSFQLAGYSVNNDLRLATNTSGTLTVTTPLSAQNVYVLAVTGSGSSVMTVQLNFTDLTSQTSSAITVADWYGGTSVALTGFQRLNRTTNLLDNSTTGPNLYQYTIPVLAANQTKLISSIVITRTSASGTTTTLNVFGISAETAAIVTCPAPTSPVVTALTTTTATLNWTQTGTPGQWQIKYGATGFNPATAGTSVFTPTKPYTLNPPLTASTAYDFFVRAICGPNDTSAWSAVGNFTTLCVGPASPTATGASRCGDGTVNLTASSSGTGTTLNWYANAVGGPSLGSGPTFTTPSLSATTTYHVAASAGSVASGIIRITEMNIGTDEIEIQNVGSATIDVTGWKLAVSNSYTSITSVNANIQTLSGTMAPAAIKTWTDGSATATNYWGSNILWNPGAFPTYTGWACLIDNNGNLVDFVAYNWPMATIQATTLTIGTASVNLATAWMGTPLDATPTTLGSTHTFSRIGTSDSDLPADFSVLTSSVGTTNAGLTLPWGGGGCESTRVPVVATVNPMPAVDLGNDTIICPGFTYNFDVTNPVSTYSWSTGSTASVLQTNTPGTYSVSVTNASGCTSSDTIVITAGIAPVNNLASASNLCEGSSIALNAGNTGHTFLWNTGAVNQVINVDTGGLYSVQITSPDGCELTSTTTVTERPLPVVNLGADTSICDGDQIVLNAGNPGNSYDWSNGAATQSVSVSDSGMYSVTVTTPFGCVDADSKHISYLPSPRAEGFNFIPLFHEALGTVKFSPLNPTDVQSYEWDFGDGSPHSTLMNPTHVYNWGGDYMVTLFVFNGCGNYSISQPINVDLTTGMVTLDNDEAQILLYPNPASGIVTVENKNTSLKMKELFVYNALGSLVYRSAIDQNRTSLSVDGLAAGIYSVRIATDKGWVVRKLHVNK